MLAHLELSEGLEALAGPGPGGVPVGGSNKSERSDPDPGEKGESRSISTGEPELVFKDLLISGSVAESTFAGRELYSGFLVYGVITGGSGVEGPVPLVGEERKGMELLVGGEGGRRGGDSETIGGVSG